MNNRCNEQLKNHMQIKDEMFDENMWLMEGNDTTDDIKQNYDEKFFSKRWFTLNVSKNSPAM